MKRSFAVIDADGHVLERERELREFLPPRLRAVKGKREYPLFSWDGWARGALSPHKREHPSVELWLRFLDAADIAFTVLYPNEGLNIGLQRDRDWAVALARAYNSWLHHEFLCASPRFLGAGQLLWGSDFPHERPWDEFRGDINALIDRTDLPELLPRNILWDNPRRFYNLKI